MFKEFLVSEILEVEQTKSVPAKANLINGNIPYVTRTAFNNGYMRTCGNSDKINKGNCITIGAESGIAFYQPVDFVAGNRIFRLSRKGLEEKEYIYLTSILNIQSKKYSYSNPRNPDKIKIEKIYLPVIPSPDKKHKYTVEDIDWEHMKKRIAELERERIAELEAYLQVAGLENYELTEEDEKVLLEKPAFKKFVLETLFYKVDLKRIKKTFKKNEDISKEKTAEYSLPLINAKNGNNGIMYYGRIEDWESEEHCIDIVSDGAVSTGNVYPQPQKTGVLYNAYMIKLNEDIRSENVLIYISKSIEKVIKEKFSYDNKAIWEKVKTNIIELPVNSSGTPDFDYMERYINALEKLVIADVVKYKDKVVETSKRIIKE